MRSRGGRPDPRRRHHQYRRTGAVRFGKIPIHCTMVTYCGNLAPSYRMEALHVIKPGHFHTECSTPNVHTELFVAWNDTNIPPSFLPSFLPSLISSFLPPCLQFVAWMEKQPHRHKIVIAGNHDITLEASYYRRGWNRFHREKKDDEQARRTMAEQTAFTFLSDERYVSHKGSISYN